MGYFIRSSFQAVQCVTLKHTTKTAILPMVVTPVSIGLINRIIYYDVRNYKQKTIRNKF